MLPARRLHHDPTRQFLHHFRAELLQALHFGGDIVGLDVDVHAALVVHPLDLHDGLVRRGLQHSIVTAAAGVFRIHGSAEGRGPEPSSCVQVFGLAVDQQCAETGVMHRAHPSPLKATSTTLPAAGSNTTPKKLRPPSQTLTGWVSSWVQSAWCM